MSSRFVSGGAIDAASGDAVPEAERTGASMAADNDPNKAARRAEWAAVERELEEERRKRTEARRAAGQAGGGEKSLYEVLQANKAAKQAAFEEAHRLKNQFRPLDEDEVEFLESIDASVRAAEARVQRETQAGLDAFRAAQKGGGVSEHKGGEEDSALEDDGDAPAWQVGGGRKRKRREEKATSGALRGVKRKGSSSATGAGDAEKAGAGGANKESPEGKEVRKEADTQDAAASTNKTSTSQPPAAAPAPKAAPAPTPKERPKPSLGLVGYGSDDDDDDDDDDD